jgi:hypothetical protein
VLYRIAQKNIAILSDGVPQLSLLFGQQIAIQREKSSFNVQPLMSFAFDKFILSLVCNHFLEYNYQYYTIAGQRHRE